MTKKVKTTTIPRTPYPSLWTWCHRICCEDFPVWTVQWGPSSANVRLKRVELSGFLPLINITWWRIGYQYRWWHIAVDSIGSCIILLFKSISKLFFRFHLRKRWLIKIMVVPKNMLIYIVLILSVLIQKKSEFPKRRENEIRGLNSSSWGSGHLKGTNLLRKSDYQSI